MSTIKTENTTNDNKTVFGPLGKYAVVAVIMVSIIVTTAIMLNKQLGTVEEQLAVMASEVAEKNAAIASNMASTEISEATVSSSANSEAQETVEVAEAEVATVEVQATEIQAVEVQTSEAQAAEVLVATENTGKETVSEAIVSTEQTSSTDIAVIEPEKSKNSVEAYQAHRATTKRDQERQARIESYKLEQKQHMAEMFARIKSLESKQLDQYKIHQDKHVERLRQRITEQEQLIEALILRNNERVDFRAASMQRRQSNREKALNRI